MLQDVPNVPEHWIAMTPMLRRIRRAVAGMATEDRPAFKRIDASPALYDDGSWLRPRD